MRLAQVGELGTEIPAVLIDDAHYLEATKVTSDFDFSFFADDGLSRLSAWFSAADRVAARPLAATRLGAPFARPHQILGIGFNDTTTADMIVGSFEIVRYLSQFTVLEPGDLIDTGTPSSVALGSDEPAYLADGDVVELGGTGPGKQRYRIEGSAR